MGREHGAAHADDTGLVDDVRQILRREAVDGVPGPDGGVLGVLEVVADDDGGDHGAADVGPRLNGGHGAGDGGVDRAAKARVVADLLAKQNVVALFHQGLTWRADVLGQGNHNLFRRREGLRCDLAGQGFHIVGVDAPEKRKGHLQITSHIEFQKQRGDAGQAGRRDRSGREHPPFQPCLSYIKF